MQQYIGTKLIEAEPESEFTFKAREKGVGQPVDSTTPDRDGYKVKYPDGYVSWSPKEAFEIAYRGNGKLSFGMAHYMMKYHGKKIARAGWNGKGMFLFLVKGSVFKVNRPPLLGIYPEGTEINYCPHIDMKTADGKVVPWLCSQTDADAEDWEIVE